MPAHHNKNRGSAVSPAALAGGLVLLGGLSASLHVASVLREERLALNLLSEGLWKRTVAALGGTLAWQGDQWTVDLDAFAALKFVLPFALCAWIAGAVCIARGRRVAFLEALGLWGKRGWLWWLLPLAWELLDLIAAITGASALESLLVGALPLWEGLLCGGWLTTGWAIGRQSAIGGSEDKCEGLLPAPSLARRAGIGNGSRLPIVVWAAMAIYVIVFGAMNWGLYESLMLPHGDSAMYEEHLWNLLHGKGFRSYLDNGRLFLGEHIQVIHLLLIPAYLLWPSQMLLELCQSAALAAGAILVYRIAFRHGRSRCAAAALAIAYLLYVPMQFLDIAVDFKTFRPNSFEIPLLLWAFDALERRRWWEFFGGLGWALLCQEDAATIIAPLGLWIAFRLPAQSQSSGSATVPTLAVSPPALLPQPSPRKIRWLGAGLALFGMAYVILVVKVVLPWFRGGEDVHFARYFEELGDSSSGIMANVLRHPHLLLRRWLEVSSIGFGLALVAPLGFLPFLSPSRLAVAAPLFGILCLSDMTNSVQHHFHAPIVPVVFWAAAAGLAHAPAAAYRARIWWRRIRRAPTKSKEEQRRIGPGQFSPSGKSLPADRPVDRIALATTPVDSLAVPVIDTAAVWCLCCSACVGLFLGMSPVSLGFWDRDSRAYWRTAYVPGERAHRFPAVLAQIPSESRVASTDFIHPRFTHFTRSYDYSDYRPEVPDDADYIVIDTRHHYSRIHTPDQVKEFRDHPEVWELLPDQTGGYFIVLRRARSRVTNVNGR